MAIEKRNAKACFDRTGRLILPGDSQIEQQMTLQDRMLSMFLRKFIFNPVFQACAGILPFRRPFSAWPVFGLRNRRVLYCAGLVSLAILSVGIAHASSRIQSKRAPHDISADTDPNSAFWRGVPSIFADKSRNGDKVAGYRMEVRSRWTPENLYILFICPYTRLYLKPDPKTDVETNGLWHWDVAEVFIGSDFQDIGRYKEFEVSPQGEWVDLDINRDHRGDSAGWKWNSGFKVSARIDPATHRWYALMKIPYQSIDSRPASGGNLLRVNFFLSEGPAGADHKAITWQPTHQNTFHVPKAFGTLKLSAGR